MYITRIFLHNFRLFDEVSFEFHERLNILCGANAKGKTSVLEAIHLLATGGSFRTSHPLDLIRCNSSEALFLDCHFVKHGIEQRLRISMQGSKRAIVYNNTTMASSASLLGTLLLVVASPDDIHLIKGGPQQRRQFLDQQIGQADPLYVHYLTRYSAAMRHRNALLKIRSTAAIECWEDEMAKAASYLYLGRQKAVQDLNLLVNQLHRQLAEQNESIHINYKGSFANYGNDEELKSAFLELFKRNRSRELEFGSTLYGPHKDDLHITLNDMEARLFASEGQMRSLAGSLRVAEWTRLKEKSENEAPIFLFDDVGMGMDESRKSRLMQYLEGMQQVFVSTVALQTDVLKQNHYKTITLS